MENSDNESIVEAIYEGRIVKVSEKYAIREGLPILRKKEISFLADPQKQAAMNEISKKERSAIDRMDSLRRPLRKAGNNVLANLIDNFHWEIAAKRREFSLTRKQFAQKLGITENEVKMIENGILPKDDYIIITRIEQLFGINLKKEGIKAESPRQLSDTPGEKKESRFVERSRQRAERMKENSKPSETLVGDDIEIDFEG